MVAASDIDHGTAQSASGWNVYLLLTSAQGEDPEKNIFRRVHDEF
jgi:hypothetical protein